MQLTPFFVMAALALTATARRHSFGDAPTTFVSGAVATPPASVARPPAAVARPPAAFAPPPAAVARPPAAFAPPPAAVARPPAAFAPPPAAVARPPAAVAPPSLAADAPPSLAADAPPSLAADAPPSLAADAPPSLAAVAPPSLAAVAPPSLAADAPPSLAADAPPSLAADAPPSLAAVAPPPPPAAVAPPPPPAAVAPPPPPAAVAPPPAAASNGGDAQTSLTLDPEVIAPGFANNGQDVPTAGQVASLTSTNNFINFCLTVNQPLTNGQQIVSGSCNPAPMGSIPAKAVMPSSKFVFPTNNGQVAADTTFTVQMAIKNLETGNFVNAQENYFSAPQQLNAQGLIKGHSHIVIETVDSLNSITVSDPNVFAFFKGLNAPADGNGILTASVDGGLPAGTYKISSINTAANHQPALVAVAQHGSLDDAIYFTAA